MNYKLLKKTNKNTFFLSLFLNRARFYPVYKTFAF